MGKRKRKSTPTEVNQWLKGVSQHTSHHILTIVHKYDEGLITKQDMISAVTNEVDNSINKVYDDAFEDGVTRSVDVEDEDNPVAFTIEEEDEDDDPA